MEDQEDATRHKKETDKRRPNDPAERNVTVHNTNRPRAHEQSNARDGKTRDKNKQTFVIFRPFILFVRWLRSRKADSWTAAGTAVIALFTIVLAGVSCYQWKEIHDGGKDTHKLAEATLAGSRAWVAPEQIILGSPVESGLPLKYQVHLVNAGKEPAIGVIWNVRPFGVSYIKQESTYPSQIRANEECSGLDPDPKKGIVLYPSGTMNFWLPLDIPDTSENHALLDAAQKREKTLFIEGCFAYITAAQKHTSAFRFFLRDIPGPSAVTDKQGNRVSTWSFNMALDGNQAD